LSDIARTCRDLTRDIYLDSEIYGEIIEIQKNLYDAFLSTEGGKYYYKNYTKNSVGYNTFLMLGENVSLDTLPLLKTTIESIEQCLKKERLVSPDCSPYEKKETTEGETKEGFAVSPPTLPLSSNTVGFGTYTPTFGGKRKKKTKIKRRRKNKYRRKRGETRKRRKCKLFINMLPISELENT